MGHSSSLTNPHPPCPLPLEPSTSCWRYPESLPWCCLHRGRCRPSATWGFRPGNKPLIRNGTPLIENRKDIGKYMNIWYNMKKTHLSGRCDGRTNYKWCVFFPASHAWLPEGIQNMRSKYPKYSHMGISIETLGCAVWKRIKSGDWTISKWKDFSASNICDFSSSNLGPRGDWNIVKLWAYVPSGKLT